MRIAKTVPVLLAGTFIASAAMAADPLPVVSAAPTATPPAPVTTLAGYVELRAGFLKRSEWEIYFDEEWWRVETPRALALGGAGRIGYAVSPSFGVQFDAWYNVFSGAEIWEEEFYEGGYDTEPSGGIGFHAIFGSDAFRFGGLVSAGTSELSLADDGIYGNIAAEMAATFGNFRLFGQVGYVIGLTDYAREDGERTLYVHGGATAYLGENLSISGNIGWARFRETLDDDTGTILTYGARIDYALADLPFSVFAAYQSRYSIEYYNDDPDDTYHNRTHTFLGGVRLSFGPGSLRDRDAAVGFADLNPIFGDPISAR